MNETRELPVLLRERGGAVDDYTRWVLQHAVGPVNAEFACFGLVEEAGEVAGKIKRIRRGDLPPEGGFPKAIAYELGDVLWYLTALAGNLGYTLDDIKRMNIEKLTARRAAGKTKGTGDTR